MEKDRMKNDKIYKMDFASIYPHYVSKVVRKGRTEVELNEVICWLTGYDEKSLQKQIENGVDLEAFFGEAPIINPNASKIKGVICGVRVEEIEEPLMQKIRWMDKLVDELAKGKAMEKVLRD
jgi:hypothetical protein